MKKYILKLIDEDISRTRKFLTFCEDTLTKVPNDIYWEYWNKRKITAEKKLCSITKYRDKILNIL